MVGHEAKKRDLLKNKPNLFICACGIVTVVLSLTSCKDKYPISMATCDYSNHLLDVVAAVFATYFIFLICMWLNGFKISRVLSFYGRISILILCIHLIDIKFGFASSIAERLHGFITNVILFKDIWHIIVPLIIAPCMYNIGLIRKLFLLK